MNYFDQLLESYSRLKKRSLVLVEQDKPATGKTEKSAADRKAEQDVITLN